MNIQKGDLVKLMSWRNWISQEDKDKAPFVWGGPRGYNIGEVLRTVTGLHDKSQHFATIRWPDGSLTDLKESDLALADERDMAVSEDDRQPDIGPVDKDIWVLIRTSLGNYSLAVIESLPFGNKDAKCRYVMGTSRNILNSVINTDYNIVGASLSQCDWTERRFGSLFEAATMIHTIWDLPELESLPLPLPTFNSIKEAAETCPPNAPAGILFFHTNRKLADFSEELPPVFAT